MNDLYSDLIKTFGAERVVKNRDLFPFLTLRTNTKAEVFVEVKTRQELIAAIVAAIRHKIVYMILGGGSNLAVSTDTIIGLVIKNNYVGINIVEDKLEHVNVMVSSGQIVSLLVQKTIEHGLEGFEYQAGLPGTVGGAVYMNSKWTHPWSFMGDHLISATLIDKNGALKVVDRNYFRFAYDYSILQKTGEVFVEGIFRLKKSNPEILKKRAQESLEYRKKTQPTGVATAGCFFRNISLDKAKKLHLSTTSAGHLIDRAGLKNTRMGAFIVSARHANFIINTDKKEGKASDLIQLVKLIKTKVKEKFGIELEEEVRIV